MTSPRWSTRSTRTSSTWAAPATTSPPGCSASAPTPGCAQAIVDARHDAQAAVHFLRANAAGYAIDPDRIAIGGSSAGAIIALETGFTPEDPGDSGNPGYDSAVGATVSLSGALILGTVNRSDAPSLLFHGTNDTVVPYDWASTTFTQAYSIALDSFLVTFPGGGHVPYAQHRTQILEQTSNFLYWELDLGYAAQLAAYGLVLTDRYPHSSPQAVFGERGPVQLSLPEPVDSGAPGAFV